VKEDLRELLVHEKTNGKFSVFCRYRGICSVALSEINVWLNVSAIAIFPYGFNKMSFILSEKDKVSIFKLTNGQTKNC